MATSNARNIEIKARVNESMFEICNKIQSIREELYPSQECVKSVIFQEDYFFKTKPNSRLKLRIITKEKRGELIYYERPNCTGPKESVYSIYPTKEFDSLLDVMTKANGLIGIVKKKRILYHLGQTRIHLDTVEGLGDFIELEVELTKTQTVEEGTKIAEKLMESLNIDKKNLIDVAYIDLINNTNTQ